ncbi:MAG: phosphatidate cytidylyltransferase [Peptococcaceae bacterium]|nr:phosphatidate cytidylyltransferase [Peptococcaceae bacterium]
MLHKRVLSAAAGVPLLLLAVWYGGWAHFVLTVLIMVLALFELNRMFARMDIRPSMAAMTAGVLILSAGAYRGGMESFGLAVTPAVALLLLVGVARYPAVAPVDVAAGLAGTLYVGLFVYFYLIRTLDGGLTWVLIMLAGTWAGDTAAYFAGKKLGRRKLAPRLSPGKTVEGALGGLAGSVLGASLVNLLFPSASFLMVVLLGLVVGVFGLMGDLFESSLKRSAGIKDAGGIIPGHGGILDRFDSMMFTAPAVYYFVYLFYQVRNQ